MSETLRNIVEARDPESAYMETVKNRIKSIKTFQEWGPPDLCYLTKEFHKSLSFSKQPSKMGFYHFIFGLDASTPASVSAHLKRLLQLQEKEKTWFSSGRWKITQGLFCIYDAFSKIDIHVEIGIPGGMKLYGYKGDETMVSVEESSWERGYISSVFRSIKQEPTKVFKIYELLTMKEHLSSFIETFSTFHLTHKGLSYSFESELKFENLGNKPLFMLVSYLLSRRLMDPALKVIKSMSEADPKLRIFQSLVLERMERIPEAIQCLANALARYPHTSVFLYKQADLLIKFRKFDLALELARIVVQLNPESFDAWFLLIKCFYNKKNYSMVLLTMNSTPIISALNSTTTPVPEPKNSVADLTTPEEKNDISIFDFSFVPQSKNLKFNRFSEELLLAHQEYLEENEKIQQKLERLAYLRLEAQEKTLYEMLVRVEADLGWDKLLALRGELFFMESDSVRNEIFNRAAEDYVIEHNEPENLKEGVVPSNNNKANDSSDEDQEHQLPSFLQNEEDNDEQIKKLKNKLNVINKETNKTLNLWDQRRSKKITELSNETYETEGPQGLKNLEDNLPHMQEIKEEIREEIKEKTDENKEKTDENKEKTEENKERTTEENKERTDSKEKDHQEVTIDDNGDKNERNENEPNQQKAEETSAEKPIENPQKNSKSINKEKFEHIQKKESRKPNKVITKSIPKEPENEVESLIKNDDIAAKSTNRQEIVYTKPQEVKPQGTIKRLCSKTMDALFLALFEDLNTFYEWEAEDGFEKEQQKGPKQPEDIGLPQLNGVIWILRGLLAERLLKDQACEIAYRKAVETGFNLFAWYRMIKLYASRKTWKAVLVCVGEVLEEILHEGVKIPGNLPQWIEEVVLECISEMGIKKFFELLKELSLNYDSINKIVREAENWKIHFKNG